MPWPGSGSDLRVNRGSWLSPRSGKPVRLLWKVEHRTSRTGIRLEYLGWPKPKAKPSLELSGVGTDEADLSKMACEIAVVYFCA